ncbi:hypothetical protein [Saccharothrix sp. Mg75]|uniref:hypothetical protein n=1 Tax=Saccharothrix sp. Mg75 TaxID=3445357 RepID=UPI003EE9F595
MTARALAIGGPGPAGVLEPARLRPTTPGGPLPGGPPPGEPLPATPDHFRPVFPVHRHAMRG